MDHIGRHKRRRQHLRAAGQAAPHLQRGSQGRGEERRQQGCGAVSRGQRAIACGIVG
ncbi:MAG: hypothetical protein NC322_06900 [Alistipes senegalensis]|nr:hypothetical protein [Alistipes senegalensis]